jgi:hypothetical protein
VEDLIGGKFLIVILSAPPRFGRFGPSSTVLLFATVVAYFFFGFEATFEITSNEASIVIDHHVSVHYISVGLLPKDMSCIFISLGLGSIFLRFQFIGLSFGGSFDSSS